MQRALSRRAMVVLGSEWVVFAMKEGVLFTAHMLTEEPTYAPAGTDISPMNRNKKR